MAQAVISEFIYEAALAPLREKCEIVYDPKLVDDRARLAGLLADCEALIVRNRTQVDAELLAAAPKLKVVGRLGVGLDNIDLGACKARGVEVKPATGANTLPVAEYVIAMALTLLRGAYASNAEMLAGAWPRNALIGREASGKRLGLVGFGGIARATGERARALGMEIAAYDPILAEDDPAWREAVRCSLAELLATADVLSLHVPLTPETRGLIGAAAIAKMKKGAVLINTARGGVVEEAALADGLRSGRLGGAALDVFENEPLTAEAARVFEGAPNLVLTPHIAGVTEEANIRVSSVTVQNVLQVLFP